ncbi:Gfo/Idh/MocA family protein [Streptomyces aidingensis]|uniref:Predicted dehydrogenase n=1 Tax=Streptomyces aidingensis TaxID=910347 RepID=A0A1I1LDA1_9ACTN|nr:Gfo/Idh/MocA family oxidoreductase [Streptomyces aidingensis]SFC70492.1 Predicted dehydrogenase [Streptomyces aidingensis]
MRFGLFGTGPWARRIHGPALAAHPEAELVGVWGRRPEAAAELAAGLATRPYPDADALFADCDAVAIALPPDIQAPLAVRAARAGRHLLLDKPLGTTPAAAREVADAVAAAQVASVVFFTLRFTAVSSAWIERQAAAGGWLAGRAVWLSSVFGGAESPYAASAWRREKGALWDVGPHALSVLLPVLGDITGPDDGLRALAGPGDTVHLLLRHTSGAGSTVSVSHTMPPAASTVAAELHGVEGISTLPAREDNEVLPAYGRAVDALLATVETGEPHPCDVRFAARVTEILAAAEAALGR